jgi:anti-sigma B factor antagonist
MSLQIAIRESGDITILDLHGRSTIDGESERLSDCLNKLVASGMRKFLLNLADLTQLDTFGVSVILATYISLRDEGGDLKLLCPRGRVMEVFRVLRLLEIIPSFDDATQALASFRRQGYAATP